MIIDAHNHPDWYSYELPRFLANMAEFGIDKCWLLSWESPEDEWDPAYNSCYPPLDGIAGPIPFSRCIAYAKEVPEKFILGYAPDPRKPGAIDALKKSMAEYNVRICGELKQRMPCDIPEAIELFDFCGKAGLPVIVHMEYAINPAGTEGDYPWWYGGSMDSLENALIRCPDTIFIGHGPGFWAHISGDDQYKSSTYPEGPVLPGGKLISMLRQHDNLVCDLSATSGINAIKRDSSFGRDFVLEFQNRILYARDCFNNNHQLFLRSMNLPEETLQKILSENAMHLVK
ncbi:MAG: amidohydrolase family protein [Armatimonadota bacterium]